MCGVHVYLLNVAACVWLAGDVLYEYTPPMNDNIAEYEIFQFNNQ